MSGDHSLNRQPAGGLTVMRIYDLPDAEPSLVASYVSLPVVEQPGVVAKNCQEGWADVAG